MDSIVSEAKEFREESLQFNSESREMARESMSFELGGENSWDSKMWKSRGERPKITINTASTKKNRLANDLRDLNPIIKLIPCSDQDEETARVKNGIIRKIQEKSGAETIYDQCFSQGLSAGFSFMKVSMDYKSPETFDMVPKIEAIPNNMGVHIDPFIKSPCYLDMKWALCENKIDRKKFIQDHGESHQSFPSEDLNINNGIVTADYYKIKEVKKKLVLLSDGQQVVEGFADDLRIKEAMKYEIDGQRVWQTIQERDSFIPKLQWYLLSGNDILDERELLGKYIPIIPYEGRVLWIEGRKYIISFVNPLMEPSRLKNFGKSIEVEQLAMAVLTDKVAPADAIIDYKDVWDSANQVRYSVLPYSHKDKDGEPIPPPQKWNYTGPGNQLQALFQSYNSDIDEISGLHTDSLQGGPSQLRSGVAIDLKQSQGNQNNFDFIDNFTSRTLKYLGVVLNDQIDAYMDSEMEETIEDNNGKPEVVKLNQEGGYNITEGEYDVKVEVGSATASERREANELLISMMDKIPGMANVGHIIAKNMDNLKDKDDVVKILKASMPPELLQIIDADETTVAAENASLKQQLEQQGMELQQASELIKSMQIDYQKAMDVQTLKSQTDLQKTQMQGENKLEEQELKNQGAILKEVVSGIQIVMDKMNELEAKVSGNTLTVEGEKE
jgi:hypothetical protein